MYGSSGGQKWRLEMFIYNRGGRSGGRLIQSMLE